MRGDDPFGIKRLGAEALEHYVVEWMLEDSARYDRLSGRAAARAKVQPIPRPGGPPKSGWGTPRVDDLRARPPEEKPYEKTTIAVVVLEIPRQRTEGMTAKLRSLAPNSTGWLSKATAHAEDSNELHDELMRKDLHIQALMTLVRELAVQIEDLETVVAHTAPDLPGQAHRPNSTKKQVEDRMTQLAREYYSIDRKDMITVMRRAIREKKTDVAAKLLAAIDDDDDLKFGR